MREQEKHGQGEQNGDTEQNGEAAANCAGLTCASVHRALSEITIREESSELLSGGKWRFGAVDWGQPLTTKGGEGLYRPLFVDSVVVFDYSRVLAQFRVCPSALHPQL